MANLTATPLTATALTARALTATAVGTGTADSYDIYVDSVSGSDSNDGATQGAAFASLAKAQTEALSIGDGVKIALVAGSEWREELDLSTLDSVTISGVGDFASDGLPFIMGDDVLSSGGWSDSGDRADANTKTYSRSYAFSISGGQQAIPPHFYEDGMLLTWQDSITAVDANPGSFYHDGSTSAVSPVTVYIHPSDSGDPASNGLDYSATARDHCIVAGDDATIKLIKAANQAHDNGSVNAGVNALFDGILGYGSPIHDIFADSGVMRRCVSWHPVVDTRSGAILLEFYATDATGLSGVFDRCIAVGPSDGIGDQNVIGMGGHSSNGNKYTAVTYTDSAATYCKVRFDDVSIISVARLNLVNAAVQAIGLDGDTDWTDVSIVFDKTIGETNDTAIIADSGAYAINVVGLRAYLDASLLSAMFQPTNLNMSNCLIWTTTNTVGNFAGLLEKNRTPGAGAEIILTDNIMRVTNGREQYETRDFVPEASGNVYSGSQSFVVDDGAGGKTAYSTLAAYQSAEGTETGSIVTSLTIADPPNNDWAITGTAGGAGLERPDITYTPIPASLSAAEAWIIANA